MEDNEFNSLKSVLRELVKTSSKPANVHSLLWDYRNTVGTHIPLTKYGYQDLTTFLREKFSDCFQFQGAPDNPVLKLIVPTTSGTVQGKKNVNEVTSSLPESVPKSSPDQNDNIRDKNVKPVSTKTPKKRRFNHKRCHPPTVNNRQIVQNKNMNICNTESKKVSENKKQQLPKEKVKGNGSVYQRSELYMMKWIQFYSTLDEIRDLLKDYPDGVWCTDVIKLYKARYGRELDYQRFGRTSTLSLVTCLPEMFMKYDMQSGAWLVGVTPLPDEVPRRDGDAAEPSGEPRSEAAGPSKDEDALPGIPYDADMFPEDCMQLQESIPEQSLAHIAPGELLDVWVTEAYSPSHFWVQLLGELHSIAVDNMMYEMNEYYDKGEGRERRLYAVLVGQYCSSIFEGTWHRAVIVKILDWDTVKVRYVDFGTVETCAASTLRVLCRKWAALPAQAIRARAADVRPAAAGRQWPGAAAAYFVHAVNDRDLVANVCAVDRRDAVLELFLVDPAPASAPAPARDVWINTGLIAVGYADPRASSVLGTSECYLYPRFDALETGATPSYNEVQKYLRSGIALADVEGYRQHVLLEGSWAPPPPQSAPPGFKPLTAPHCAPEFVATVTLFASEVEMFLELGRRNPLEAYHLMKDALSRAVSASGCLTPSTASVLNPEAAEFRPASESSRR